MPWEEHDQRESQSQASGGARAQVLLRRTSGRAGSGAATNTNHRQDRPVSRSAGLKMGLFARREETAAEAW